MELPPKMFKKILPMPLTLITTIDKHNVPNAAPYGCVMPILKPLDLIALASAIPRDTLKNIRDTKEFVVNVIGRPGFRKCIKCAKHYAKEIDELKEVGLETTQSKEVKAPRVKEAIGWIEATLEKEIVEENYVIVIGKVVCAEVNDSYVRSGELIEPPLVILAPYFRLVGDKVANREEFSQEIGKIKF